MIEIQPHAEGVVISVRALPGAKQNRVRGAQQGALRVSVTQVAEKGKANRALCKLLARELQLKRSQVEIISGETAANKKVLLRDVDSAALTVRLQQIR